MVVSPQWEIEADSSVPPKAGASQPAFARLALIAALVIVAGLVIAARNTTEDLVTPETTQPQTTSSTPLPTSTLPSAPGTRAFAQFDGQVLGVDVGASLVSTDFDGRLFALDLDSGILTRSQIRTGNFVTLAGQLVVQNGCGGWQIIDVPSFTPSGELIGCSSYLPVGQLGAETLFFAEPDSGEDQDVLIDDGNGGLAVVQLDGDPPSSVATVSDGRVLIDRAGVELVWIDPITNETESYANGQLLAAGPGGILWSNSCDSSGTCRVWFGTPDDPRLNQFVVEPFDLDRPTRINPEGSRAVFFKPDDVLRIVTTETGHAREIANPGISAAGATWSPDGLWLLETSGANIVALNTLNGRFVEFEGVPGDFSPGWIALPKTN